MLQVVVLYPKTCWADWLGFVEIYAEILLSAGPQQQSCTLFLPLPLKFAAYVLILHKWAMLLHDLMLLPFLGAAPDTYSKKIDYTVAVCTITCSYFSIFESYSSSYWCSVHSEPISIWNSSLDACWFKGVSSRWKQTWTINWIQCALYPSRPSPTSLTPKGEPSNSALYFLAFNHYCYTLLM